MSYEVIFILLSLFSMLYMKSRIFRYYFKFVLIFFLYQFVVGISIPIVMLRPFHYDNALIPGLGGQLTSRIFGIKWKILGQKNLVQDQGSVILMNHQSLIDVLLISEVWPVFKKCFAISKKQLFYVWPFGLCLWLCGTVFIDRSSKEEAITILKDVARRIRLEKIKVCLFPEGTRHGGEKLLSFKKGPFHIALDTEAPIQPVVIKRYSFLDHKNYIFNQGTSIVSILPTISTKGLKKEDINDLIEKTYKAMSMEYDRLNSEF